MRKLTFFGKIIVIKSVILPKVTYLLQNTFNPKEYLNTLNSLFFKFLWSNKSEKIKRKTLIGKKLNGGLDMIGIHTFSKSLKVKWIKNLRDSTLANGKVIPKLYLDQFGKNLLIFDMNIDSFKS